MGASHKDMGAKVLKLYQKMINDSPLCPCDLLSFFLLLLAFFFLSKSPPPTFPLSLTPTNSWLMQNLENLAII